MIDLAEYQTVEAFEAWLVQQPESIQNVVSRHIEKLVAKGKRLGVKGAMQVLSKIYALIYKESKRNKNE